VIKLNQIIIIGEVIKIDKLETSLNVVVKTKDFDKKNCLLTVSVESGYKEEMVDVLNKKPLIAVKCGLKVVGKKVEFIAEKMSVLKLSEEEKET
jgi:hypothetical protein